MSTAISVAIALLVLFVLYKIFTSEEAAPEGKVEEWVKKREEVLSKKNSNREYEAEDFLAAVVLRAALGFGGNSNSSDSELNYEKKDVSVFEVGCYLIFKIDLWLFLKEPTLRDPISNSLQASFVKLFAGLFNMDSKVVEKILNERLELFGRLAREKESIEGISFYIEQLLSESKNNDIPKSHGNFEKWDSINLNFVENSMIQARFFLFEKHIVPALYESMYALCTIMKA